jgi:hypothetical protein
MIGFVDISFTVTVNYDSLQLMTAYDSLHCLLGHEGLRFHCDESLNCLEGRLPEKSHLRFESYVTIDSQSASVSWNKASIWG